MEGVWLWADHFQAIHSQAPSYGLRNCSSIPQKNFRRMEFWRMKNQCLQDEGLDCSSHHMRAFMWGFKGSRRVA